ncbi:MAG: formyltransferase family protein [Acidimicrobiia bacterium]|nr:formyltransferase family protein [Acidimicrobiia bacterium]
MGMISWRAGATVIGCRENTAEFVDKLLRSRRPVAGIVTISEVTANKNGVPAWADLDALFGRDIPVHVATSYRLDGKLDIASLSEVRADVGFCIGWQRLLPSWFLALHRNGVFGMHASAALLPDGRGRSPINWGLIEGAGVLHAHLFRYSDEPDTGDLLSVTPIRVEPHDDIQTLQQKARVVFNDEIDHHWDDLASGTPSLTPLRSPVAGDRVYPKRCPDDGAIDWSWSALRVTDWVRAQTRPYPGAFATYENARYHVWRCGPAGIDHDLPPGTVLDTFSDGKCIVACGDHESVHLLDHDLPSSLSEGQRVGTDL